MRLFFQDEARIGQKGRVCLTIHQFCQTDHSAGSSQRDCRQA